ncbi:hypothetical protein LJB96_04410 [Methanobrevibacter sp. OttesenSCG-928-K11]|nr:hypothetical protein [Methanobrevibacter sp. OttesenSCG-928-K11]
MPIEKDLNLTRDILKTFLRFKFPVHIITKSDLILRDIDILEKINNEAILPEDLENKLKSKVIISFSFSTIDDEIAKIMEPNAPLPSKRLETIKELSKYFTVGVAFMPILPYIGDNDVELDKAISKFSQYNCQYILPGSLSLFGNNENSSRIKYYKAIEIRTKGKKIKTKLRLPAKEVTYLRYIMDSHFIPLEAKIKEDKKGYKVKINIINN